MANKKVTPPKVIPLTAKEEADFGRSKHLKSSVLLVICNVRSILNVGSMFRTADAAGVEKVYLCGYTPRPTDDNLYGATAKMAKTALGAEKTMPWEYCGQAWRLLRKLKVESPKLRVIALEQSERSKNLFSYRPTLPIALIVGNEVRGLSPKILKYCDDIVEIPMYGKKESLNVSVATGVALYALKNRLK